MGPTLPPFLSMITGSVHELFAYSHHFKWWREVKIEEREWDSRHDAAARAPVQSAGTGAESSGEHPVG